MPSRRAVRRPRSAPSALADRLESRQLLDAITWDGGGDNSTWGDPLNWSTDTVPVAGDTATIDTLAGSGEITLDGAFEVDSFASDRPLRLNSGSLSFSAASHANAPFVLAAGALAGAGNLTVSDALLWTGGTMTGTGAIVVQSGASFVINGGGAFSKPVTNAGTVTWASGAVQHDTGAFTNQAGGLFRVQTDITWHGTALFTNAGAVNKTGTGTATIGSAFNHTGSLAVLAGTLALTGDVNTTGSFKVFPGTSLEFEGNVLHGAGGSYTGAGTILVSGGTHTFGANATLASRFTFNTGTVQGAGHTTFTGPVTWTGGTFSGTGDTIFASSSVLTITGAFAKFLLREMYVNGTVQWIQGTLSMAEGRLVTGGTINIVGNAAILGAGGSNLMAHHGSLVKTSSSITTINVPLQGSGSWSVHAGTLTLSGGGVGTGNRFVAAGATLRFTNSYAHNGGAILGEGTVLLEGGTHTIGVDINANTVIELNQGMLAGPGDLFIGTRMEWNGGTMSGAGFTAIRPGAELEAPSTVLARALSRRIVNNGDFNWTGGDIRMQSGSIVNGVGKTIAITGDSELAASGGGGTVINFGTIAKTGTGTAIFAASSTGGVGARMNNKGTVSVTAGSLILDGGVLQVVGGTLVEGTWSVTGPGILDLPGISIATIGTAASVTLTGATASFGAIGSLSGNRGTLTLATGAQLAVAPVSGAFTNTGTIHLGRGSQLLVAGSFAQGAGGDLEIDIAGTGAANFGRINVVGGATLAGSLTVAYVGFTPTSGQVFQFLQAVSRTGQFTSTTLPPSPPATVTYLATGARLTIT